jgi:O-antigen/teichoic acid export membrane protein
MGTIQDADTSNLTGKTLQGIFWTYLSFAGGKGLTFVATIILARLLTPAEFGLMGYCLIVTQYLDILNLAGFDNALISRREDIDEAASVAFLSNLVLGLVWFAVAWLLAPLAAGFFKTEQVTGTLRVLAFSLPLASLGMVPDAMIRRSLRFKTKLVPDLGRTLSRGLVSIGMALSGFGVWSLVGGHIASVTAATALSWKLAQWKPVWRLKPQVTRAVWAFGMNIVLLELVGAFHNNVDYLLVGRILGAAALGYYTMAFRIPELILRSLNYVVGKVAFPVLAQTQADPGKLRAFYFGYIRYLALFVYPVGLGLALTAPISIPLILSDQWLPAVIPTALISVALAIMAIGYVPGVLYKAIGRPDILNKLAVVKLPTSVLILWVATRWGINGVAAGQIAIAMMLVSIDTLVANKLMGYSLIELARALFPGLSSTLAMSAVLWGVWQAFQPAGWPGLALLVGVGGAAYLLVLCLVSRETVVQGLAVLQGSLSRSRLKPAGTASHE